MPDRPAGFSVVSSPGRIVLVEGTGGAEMATRGSAPPRKGLERRG